jgi:hypothetical protein
MKTDKEMAADQALIDETLKVYNIPREFLFHSRIDPTTGEAVVVTHGGKKLRHKKGENAKCELTQTEITGRPPEEELVWSEQFNQKIDLKRLFGKRKSKE